MAIKRPDDYVGAFGMKAGRNSDLPGASRGLSGHERLMTTSLEQDPPRMSVPSSLRPILGGFCPHDMG
jgi:hypothetical protein